MMNPETTSARSISPSLSRTGSADPTSMVVLTGVDGALRDGDTRSWADARSALQLLSAQGIPLVLASRHSAAELIQLQHDLGLRQPFICESGAALYIPMGYFSDLPGLGAAEGDWEIVEFGERRLVVCEALYQLSEELRVPVTGFSRLSSGQLAVREGLSLAEAELALQRQFDEPFVIADESLRGRTRLFNAMRHAGFQCFSSRRYHYATGVQDPAHAIRLLISLYRLGCEQALVVGLGDDWTDRALLREVDVPVVVRNRTVDQRRLLRKIPAAYLTKAAGPAGWSEAILGSFAA